MGGRWPIYGESDAYDFIDQKGVLNRTIRAQVSTVDGKNGFLKFNYDGLPGGEKFVTIPPLWMSFPKTGGLAWGRFIPQPSDIIKIAFDYDDRPHVVGYDVIANVDDIADGHSGWPGLNSLYDQAKADPSKKIDVNISGQKSKIPIAKFGQFMPLEPGSYDFMSSGGAYICGDSTGKLFLSTDAVSTTMTPSDLNISSVSQHWIHTADACKFRFGQVRRPDQANSLDKIVSGGGDYKEFSAKLQTSTSTQTLDLASIQLGNVVVDTGSTEQLDSKDVRFLLRSYNTSGTQEFEMGVDVDGNCKFTGGSDATTGLTVDYNSGEFIVNAKKIKLQGANASPEGDEPLLLGNTYKDAEKQMVSDFASHITDLTTQLTQLLTGLTSFCATASGDVIATTVAAAATTLTAQLVPITVKLALMTALPTNANGASQKFNNAYSTYLSNISYTG
jgi:hypothetical protein